MPKRTPASAKAGGVVDRLSTPYSHLWGKKPQVAAPQRGMGTDVRDLYATASVREALRADAAQAAALNLIAGSLGEASVRLANGKFLATAAASWFYSLADADLVLASAEPDKGFVEQALPVFWRMHLAGYGHFEQAHACLLGQPAAAMALLADGRVPDATMLVGAQSLGRILYVEQTELSPEALGQARCLFVKGAGVLVFASTLQQAVSDLHLINRLSEISSVQTRGRA